MNIKLNTGRELKNVWDNETRVAATASAEPSVINETEGVCPKCMKAMGMARIPYHHVYYCSTCRVATPMSEGE